MKIYDISKLLDKKTAIYPGNPKFEIQKVKEINKDGYNLSSFSMGTHFGTHLDSPLHFIEGGEDISSIDLSYLVGYCNVLNLENVVSCIRKEDLSKLTIDTNIVVLKTKNSNVPYNKFSEDFIYLDQSAIEYVVDRGVTLLCTDGPSVKERGKKDFQHKYLFENGVYIIEGVDLKGIREGKYFFVALPLKIKGADGSPSRVILIKK